MKSKIKIVSIVLFLSVSILLVSFSEQKTEWKGKIEYENGIKVIKNPQEPLYGEIEFELEENLSIGREDDDNYMFYRNVRIAVDSDDNIFVIELPEVLLSSSIQRRASRSQRSKNPLRRHVGRPG